MASQPKPKQKPVVGYWPFGGRAFPARCMLHYLEIDFEDKQYAFPGLDPSKVPADHEWFSKDKPALKAKNPFINLPYFHEPDHDKVTCESVAVAYYIGNKWGLAATNVNDQALELTISGAIQDVLEAFVPCIFASEAEKPGKIKDWIAKYTPKFEAMETYLKSNGKKFCVADSPTWVDFDLFGLMELVKPAFAEEAKKYPEIAKIGAGLLEKESLKKYVSSL